MREATHRAMFFIAFAGLLVSLYLVYSDLRRPGYCPRLFSIPACYLVLCSFGLVLFSAIASTRLRRAALFFPGAVLGLGLGAWFSVRQALGTARCPQFMDLPLCYVSLTTFLVLFVLKVIGDRDGGSRQSTVDSGGRGQGSLESRRVRNLDP